MNIWQVKAETPAHAELKAGTPLNRLILGNGDAYGVSLRGDVVYPAESWKLKLF